MNKTFLMYTALVVLIIGGLIFARANSTPPEAEAGEYDEFAQCIADSGASFYGAFWCPHCESQRDMFGASKRLLPYIECSTPNGQAQTQACIDAGIQSYPTWDLADGTRINGVQSFEQLAEATNCAIPGDDIPMTNETTPEASSSAAPEAGNEEVIATPPETSEDESAPQPQ